MWAEGFSCTFYTIISKQLELLLIQNVMDNLN